MSVGVMLLVYFLSKRVVFDFPLVPWPILSDVLGHLNSAGHGQA